MRRLGPGSVVADRYRVERNIGRGSMGAVYEVIDVTTGARAALKLLHSELFEVDPRAAHRFEREARLSAQLAHPNVVRTFDTGIDEPTGTPWLVMELLEGVNLTEHVTSNGPLAGTTLATAARELFGAVAAAHTAGIVHRDLKPDNVMVVHGGDGVTSLRVLDFGIAREMITASASVTATGLGTPLWAAPEQGFEGFRPVPRTDVWALGLLAFYLVTARLYWLNANSGGSVAALAMELLRGAIVPPSRRAAELRGAPPVPAGFDEWFARCVCRKADERFADAGQALAALEPVLGD